MEKEGYKALDEKTAHLEKGELVAAFLFPSRDLAAHPLRTQVITLDFLRGRERTESSPVLSLTSYAFVKNDIPL